MNNDNKCGQHFKTRAIGKLYVKYGTNNRSVMEATLNEMQFQNSQSVDKYLNKLPNHIVFKDSKCNARKLMHLADSAE